MYIQLFIFLVIACLYAFPAKAQTCPDIKNSILAGQDWIVHAQKPNGLFTYEYFPFENRVSDDDNIVRQVGTFWALVETLRFRKTPRELAVVNNFRDHVNKMIVRAPAGNSEVAYVEYNELGKLNTTALYVLAIMGLIENDVELTEKEEELLPLLINGLKKMSDEKGGFFYIYYVEGEKNHITPYGSGEALFALAKYYEHIGDKEGLKWTYEAFKKYFDRFLKDEDDFRVTPARGFFSWGIYALEIINRTFPVEYDETVKGLLRIAMGTRAKNAECRDRGCMLAMNVGDGTFFEGMIQAYKMALQHEKDPDAIEEIRTYIDLALRDYIALQILDVDNFQVEYRYLGDPKKVYGAVCWDSQCQRIRNDTTQHVVSAFMYYHDFFCSEKVTDIEPAS